MSYDTDRRLDIKYLVTGGSTYAYVEFPVTQQESIYGFHLEVTSNKLIAGGPINADVLVGMLPLDPVTETAGNTVYDVNGAGASSRNLGTFNPDFTTHKTNTIFVQPGVALGAATLPDVLPPIFGIYFKNDGIRIANVYKSRGV